MLNTTFNLSGIDIVVLSSVEIDREIMEDDGFLYPSPSSSVSSSVHEEALPRYVSGTPFFFHDRRCRCKDCLTVVSGRMFCFLFYSLSDGELRTFYL